MISKFDVPHLKLIELVSSISTKFNDCGQKIEFNRDSHIDQASTTIEREREIYLKEDEKKHVFNM